MATSVWADDLKTSYMDHLMTEHSAEAFSLPETYGPVDDWIEEKTNGKIKVLMGDGALDPLTAALLVDAVYFKGTWKYEFSPVDTTDDVFYHRDGSQTSAKYMKASRTMEAIKSTPLLGDASFVVLDYGEDAEFAALFILPGSSSKESMDDVIAGLTSHSISELVEEATEVNVNLKLPRFHLAFGPSQLKPHLMNMGMKIAFDPDVLGKFNRMSYDRGLYVDDVHHGACMEVNEEGTEAAAATVVDMMYRGLPRDDESVKLTFDRPFVVVIFQRSSGIPLFMALEPHCLPNCATQVRKPMSLFLRCLLLYESFTLTLSHWCLTCRLPVYRALELVEDGATANSDNRAELDRLLGPQELREQVKAVIDSAGSGVQLNMATSVWADDLKTSYMDHLMTEHSAEAFSLPETYGPVDDWIEEKTNGKIKVLMGDDALDPLTAALLVDAVYFKGTWKYEFSPVDTTDDVFYHRDGSQTSAKYMKASRTMEAIKSTPLLGDASFVVLDYGEDAEFAALFILPGSSSKESMDDVIAGLTSHSISELVEEATEVNVNLKLPRFHLAFGPSQLKPHLMNMGMKIAFDPDVLGKFNRMSYDKGLYVDDVHHGACMEVNEEGTEAAAATVVVVNTRSRPREDRVDLTFDRPFVVVIFQRSSGIPLFMGRVEDPNFI
eukprot:CCRYP_018277-RA/>CCRYP_018277-RA protein AED:0.32 eAED:0.35 QI:0/0/0/1/0/0/3/0/664